MEFAQLGSAFISDSCLHNIEGDVVPIVAYLADAHDMSGDCSNLKHRNLVAILITELQRSLAKVGDRPAVTHEELLPAPASR